MKELRIQNRQRARSVNTKLLCSIAAELSDNILSIRSYALLIHLVSPAVSADLNEHYLGHEGPTDVITFDLRRDYESTESGYFDVAGEIHICLKEAERQAREFGTNWPDEMVRYLVHGVLHLTGYDDLEPPKRKIMKREENRLVRLLRRRFNFAELAA